nr:5660_t:CDS:2 [Entrophospora candida]
MKKKNIFINVKLRTKYIEAAQNAEMVILIVKGDKPTTPRSNDIPIPYVEVMKNLWDSHPT